MKIIKIVIFIILVNIAFGVSEPVLYYPLNSDGTDYSGQDYNATNITAENVDDSYYGFNSSNDEISYSESGDTSLDLTNQISIGLWFKSDETGTYEIITKTEGSGNNKTGYELKVQGNSIDIGLYDGTNNSQEVTFKRNDYGYNILDGNWHFITFTWQNLDEDVPEEDKITLYIDGKKIGSKDTDDSFLIGTNDAPLEIKGKNNTQMYIDEFRIFSEAIPIEDVMIYAETTSPGSEVYTSDTLPDKIIELYEEENGEKLTEAKVESTGGDGLIYIQSVLTSGDYKYTLRKKDLSTGTETIIGTELTTNNSWSGVSVEDKSKYIFTLKVYDSLDTFIVEESFELWVNEEGIILYYDFETEVSGNVEDISGFGNHGFKKGNFQYDNLGKWGRAGKFDGSGDYVSISNLNYGINSIDELTVVAWIKSSSSDQQIIASFDRSETWRLALKDDVNEDIGWDTASDSTGGRIIDDLGTTFDYADGEWHLVVGWFDKDSSGYDKKIYVDGELVAYSENAHDGNPLGYDLNPPFYGFIGTGSEANSFDGNTGPNHWFNGSIDEFRIYHKALTDEKIKELYEQEILSAYYPLDIDTQAQDMSGNENHGTIIGELQFSEDGKIEGAAQLDGIDDYIEIPDDAGLPMAEDMTISAWVYIEEFETDWVRVVGKGNSTNRNYGLWYHPNGTALFQIYGQDGSSYANARTSSGRLEPGKWYLMTGTKKNNEMKLYIDGKESANASIDFTPAISTDPVTIGYAGFHTYHNGKIDNVHIKNEAMNSDDIYKMYLNKDLILYYPFDGNALDESIYENDGNVTGATLTQDRDDNTNSAYRFDGDDFIDSGNSSSLDVGNKLTISAWVKWGVDPSNGDINSPIVTKGLDDQYRLQHDDSNERFEFSIDTSEGDKYLFSKTKPEVSKWYLVTGTYDGTTMKIYVNGRLEESVSHSGNIEITNENLYIGRYSDTRYFQGVIDEVKIYKKALSEGEIKNMYLEGDLALYYSFDDENSMDMSGNGNHGKENGDASYTSNGKIGKGLSLDGDSDYISISNLNYGANSINEITVATWIKSDSDTQQIVASFDRSETWRLALRDDVNDDIGWDTASDDGAGGRIIDDLGTAFNYNDGEWHFVVGWFDKDGSGYDKKIYVDGELAAYTENAHDGNPLGYDLNPPFYGFIGTGSEAGSFDGSTGPNHWFDGDVDEFRIYHKALTDTEIKELYNQEILSAYYPLDTDTLAQDISGNDNHGTIKGEVSFTEDGKIEGAAEFDGINDYIEIPDDSGLPMAENMTISAWVYIEEYGSDWVRVVGKGNSTNRNYGLWYHPNGTALFQIYGQNGSSYANARTSSGRLETGKWYLMTGTKKNNEIKLYINGKESANDNINFDPAISKDPVTIGYAGFHTLHNGRIDNVHIKNEAMSAEDIYAMYKNNDLVLYYPFDGNALDESLYGNNGLVNGATLTEDKNSINDRAYDFDGDDYIDGGKDNSLNVEDEITLSAWIKWDIDPSSGDEFSPIISKDGNGQYRLQHSQNNDKFEISVNTDNGDQHVYSTTGPEKDEWYYVTGTYDGSTIKIYINGKLENSAAHTGKINSSSEDLYVGRHSFSRYFNGAIDEVKVYKRALTQDEIKTEYLKGDLALYYSFDDESAEDLSGNNNHGKENGDIIYDSSGKIGKALYLDGTGDYISISNLHYLEDSIDEITVATWIKSNSSNQQIIASFDRSETWRLALKDDVNDDIGWDTASGDGSGGRIIDDMGSAFDYNDGEWHFVVGWFDKDSSGYDKKIYVDGELVAYKENSHDGNPLGYNLDPPFYGFIGTGSEAKQFDGRTGPNHWFEGSIDEFRIYHRALTDTEIQNLYQQEVLSAHYPLDTDTQAKDVSGNENHGTKKGDVSFVEEGKIEGAAIFDGDGDYIEVPDDSGLPMSEDMTISAWIYIDEFGNDWVRVVGKGNSTNRNYGLWYHPNGTALFQIYGQDGSSYGNARTENGRLESGKWYLLTGIKKDDNMKLYIDGEESAAANINFTPAISTDPVTIGYAGFHTYHNGKIDDVYIKNEAMDPEEIYNMFKSDNLVLYYPFTGTALDKSVYGNDGVVKGATLTEDINSEPEKAYNFDSGDYIDSGNDSSLNTGNEITVSAWIKWNIDPSTGESHAQILSKNGDDQYQLQHNSDNSKFEFAINTSNGRKYIHSNATPLEDEWYLVTATYDGSNMKIYVNSELENQESHIGEIEDSVGSLNIGRRSTGDRYFNGVIDEVRIYKKALTSTEIKDIYLGQGGDLGLYYSFEKVEGNKVIDESGNNYHGLINGGAIVDSDGVFGNSLSFDGADDYIAISNMNYNSPGVVKGITVCAWVKSDKKDKQIIASFDRSETWRLALKDDVNSNVGWDTTDENGAIDDMGTTEDYTDGNWHFVVGWYDSTEDTDNKRIYVDMNLVSKKDAHDGNSLVSDTLRYGFVGVGSEANSFNGRTGPNYYFNGKIDDFRIYNRALTEEELRHLFIIKKVRINEIMWDGSDEYIELKNNSNNDIDLQGYSIENAGSSTYPNFEIDIATGESGSTTIIPANGYLLIKDPGSTNWEAGSQTVKTNVFITKDRKLVLTDTGENLILKDSFGRKIEETGTGSGWFKGIDDNKVSMERYQESIIPPGLNGDKSNSSDSWYTHTGIIDSSNTDKYGGYNGTPGEKNSLLFEIDDLDPFEYDMENDELNMTINLKEYLYGSSEHNPLDYIDNIEYAVGRDGNYSEEAIIYDWKSIEIGTSETISVELKDKILDIPLMGDYYIYIRAKKGNQISDIFVSPVIEMRNVDIWDVLENKDDKDYDITLNGDAIYGKITLGDSVITDDIEGFEYKIYKENTEEISWKDNGNSLNIEESLALEDGKTYNVEIRINYGDRYSTELKSNGIKYISGNFTGDIKVYKGEDKNNQVPEKSWSNTGSITDGSIYIEWGISSEVERYEYSLEIGEKTDIASGDVLNWNSTTDSSIAIDIPLEDSSYTGKNTFLIRNVYEGDQKRGEAKEFEVWIDDISPDLSLVEVYDLRSDLTEDIEWTNGEDTYDTIKYKFTNSATDDISGIESYEYRLTGGSISIAWENTTPGVINQKSGLSLEEPSSSTSGPTYYNEIKVTDKANNISYIKSNGFKFDKTDPDITNLNLRDLRADLTEDIEWTNGEENQDTIKYGFDQAVDNLSGIDSYEYRLTGGSITITWEDTSSNGIHQKSGLNMEEPNSSTGNPVYYNEIRIKDIAGNQILVKSDGFRFDKTKPEIQDIFIRDGDQVYRGKEPDEYYFNDNNIQFNINIGEELSGMDIIRYGLTDEIQEIDENIDSEINVYNKSAEHLFIDEVSGTKNLYVQIYDRAGNISDKKSNSDFGNTLIFDNEPPEFNYIDGITTDHYTGYESTTDVGIKVIESGTTDSPYKITQYKNYEPSNTNNPKINFVFKLTDNNNDSDDLKMDINGTIKGYDDLFSEISGNQSFIIQIGGEDIQLDFKVTDRSGNFSKKQYEHIDITQTPRIIDGYINIYGKKRHIKYIEDMETGIFKKYQFDSDE